MNSEDASYNDVESDPISDSSPEDLPRQEVNHAHGSEILRAQSRPNASRGPNEISHRPSGIRKARNTRLRQVVRSLRKHWSDDYRDLLNEEISNAARKTIWDSKPPGLDRRPPAFKAGQVGMTTWSTTEKTNFFDALARLGIHDLTGISKHVETKSEPEIQAFLGFLEESTLGRAIEYNFKLLVLDDFPAAVEISISCCDALDLAAEALELSQRNQEEEDEAAKRGQFWLLTQDEGLWVESHLHENSSGDEAVMAKIPGANLLDLQTWLHLSEKIFMNGDADSGGENWRSYAAKGETPSMRLAAFKDFHTLAVSITKRLVQTVLFHAMSRIRAMDSSAYRPSLEVRMGDVQAATLSLGMKQDTRQFWKEAARRNRVRVFEGIPTTPTFLPYDEVEQFLSFDVEHSPPSHDVMTLDKVPSTHKTNSSGEQVSASASERSDTDDPSGAISSSPTSSIPSSPLPIPESDHQKMQDDLEDIYLDAIDLKNSHAEEERLWQDILQQEPRELLTEIKVPTRPRFAHQPATERKRWWGRFEYRPEWEVFGSSSGEEDVEGTESSDRPSRHNRTEMTRDRDINTTGNDEMLAEETQEKGEEGEGIEVEEEDLYGVSSDEIMLDAEKAEEESESESDKGSDNESDDESKAEYR